MFDAKRLLGQVISSQIGSRGGFGGGSGGFGGGGSAALVGGLASLLLGSKKGRRLGGSAAQMRGLALVGSLAYRAFQSWQAQGRGGASWSQPGASAPAPTAGGGSWSGGGGWAAQSGFAPGLAEAQVGEAAPGTPFQPASEGEQQDLARGVLRAMIAAAKADGHLDTAEQANIFAAMDKLDLDQNDKAFVMDELRGPLDVDAVAREARNPEQAAAIYTASLLAIDVDSPAERGYLAMLAARLRLEDALVQHLHATVEEAGRTP